MRKIVYTLIAISFTNLFFGQVQTYHDTQGKLEVTNSGQVTYTLPIALPPSIQDVGPTINLVYASGQIGGLAGQGWNIDGISTISRIATRRDIDGFVDGVDFDDNDKLALDGQRLLLKTGTYWGDGSTYETEIQSNAKIELTGTGTDKTFIVTAPDGSRSWYARSYVGSGVVANDLDSFFYIKKYEDANGNIIEYRYAGYAVGGNESYPKLYINEIVFGKNSISNPTHLNKIKFNYTTASRIESTYIKGIKWDKSHILNGIEVYTNLPNDALFRKYDLTYYPADGFGYDRLQKITEYNGSLEAANPVEFEYNTTDDGIGTEIQYQDSAFNFEQGFEQGRIAGDIDGDGNVNFVWANKLSRGFNSAPITLPFFSDERKTFYIKTLVDNKLYSKNYILNVEENLINGNRSFNVYTVNSVGNQVGGGVVQNVFSKNITLINNTIYHDTSLDTSNFGYGSLNYSNYNNNCYDITNKSPNNYLNGDFNGDGITEVLIENIINERYYFDETTVDDPINNYTEYTCNTQTTNDGVEMYLLDLNPNSSTVLGEAGYLKLLNFPNLINQGYNQKYIQDFNGDGKDDILYVKNDNTYKVISFNQILTSPWIETQIIGEGTFSTSFSNRSVLFGDYNGDGKTDILVPIQSGKGCEDEWNCDIWHVYYSNPKQNFGSLFEGVSQTITDYMPVRDDYDTQVFYNHYLAYDANKDGVTDLVRIETRSYSSTNFWDWNHLDDQRNSYRVRVFAKTPNGFVQSVDTGALSDGTENGWTFYPVAANQKRYQIDYDLVLYRPGHYVNGEDATLYINFNKNIIYNNNIKKVIQPSGVQELEYVPFKVYKDASINLNYPIVEVPIIPNNYLVQKLKNTNIDGVKYQDFKYLGNYLDYNRGMLGFSRMARSNWYSLSSTNKIWVQTDIDLSLRGAVKNIFTLIKSNSDNYSLSNTTAGNDAVFNSIQNYYYPPLIDLNSKKYTLLLQQKTISDKLNESSNITTTTYSTDGYYLPSTIVSTIKRPSYSPILSQTTTNTLFDNVISGTGSGYYIGRPKEITTTVTAYGDTHTTNEKLFYTNGNITRKEKKVGTTATSIATATETLIEIMDYFPNGNLKLKTISSSGFPVTVPPIADRTVSYTYDPTNRFIKTTTDAEGLVTTNDSYHPLYGLPLSQTNNTLAQTTTSIYDNWGKRTKVTDFLGKYIDYIYTKSNNIYRTTENGSDGSSSYIENDALSRVIKKATKNINNVWSYTSTEYDWLGRNYRESEPYFETETPKWSTITYDDYSRPIQVNAFTGKVITTTYNGLTTTTNDGILIKTATKNSNGHLVSSNEVGTNSSIGGTITYTYNALGNLLTSVYDGATVTMQYDLWGRKTSINDPSAGLYSYVYNAYGEVLKETSPKGFTDYTYTPTGKILTKWVKDAVTPLNTNINTTYNYDPTYKWISSMSVVNPFDGNSTYTYTYDIGTANGFTNTKQLKKTVETLTPTGAGTVTFTKDLSFDTFGRVLTETSTATAHGNTSAKVITNSYINGELYQIFDGATATGTPIWKANTLNARGQLLTGSLGNGITISNEYDQYGYPKKIKHDKVGTNPLNITTLEYTFTPSTGNLEERKNTNVFERNFTLDLYNYDALDRLDGDASLDYYYFNFDNGYDGFLPIGGCFLSNVNSKLKVDLNSINSGVEKLIKTVSKAGENIQIEFEMTPFEDCNPQFTPFLCNNTDLRCSIYEKDPTTGAINVLGDNLAVEINRSVFLTQNSNKNIYLKFYILQSNNGYNPKFKFTLDDVTYSFPPDDYTYQTYHNSGKINANYLGTYNYNKATATPPKPYQNTSVTLTDEGKVFYGSRSGQVISYNAIQRPIQISEGNQKIDFGYNTMQQRMVMYYGNANANKTLRPYRKYYSADGSMEINYTLPVTTTPTAPAKVEFFTYIGGDAYSAPIVNRKIDTATSENFYLHRDYQGSILAITNSVGTVVEKRTFDAWGNITKVQDGAGNSLTKLTFFDRGYTGHEHLQAVGLINMNARLYDPKLRRLLQPDNFIQDPTSTQDYNRYAYAHNNPTKYIDPDGNNPIVIGIAIAVGSFLVSSAINHQSITFFGIVESAMIGGFVSAATFGIGTAVSSIKPLILKATVQAVAHGVLQGGMSYIQGGKFWSGFAAGSISSLAASAWMGGETPNGKTCHWNGVGGKWGGSAVGTMAFGALSGGAAAALTGGNFWNGAVTGLIVSGVNHLGHHMKRPNLDELATEKYGKDYKETFNIDELKWGSEIPKEGISSDMGLATYNADDKIIRVGGQRASGFTLFANGKNTIYFSDILADHGILFIEGTMGHEFVHAYHHVLFGNNFNTNFSEYSAYQFQIDFLRSHPAYNIGIEQVINKQATYKVDTLPYNYHYQCIPGF